MWIWLVGESPTMTIFPTPHSLWMGDVLAERQYNCGCELELARRKSNILLLLTVIVPQKVVVILSFGAHG